jgi:hypothetical protein
VPEAFLNETDFQLLWPSTGPNLQRNNLDFSQVTGGSLFLALGSFDPVHGFWGGSIHGVITDVAVPEPGTIALFASALFMLIMCNLKRPALRILQSHRLVRKR